MNRARFIDRLRRGLESLPPSVVEDLVRDYDAHFAEGNAAGRSDVEVADALGDPGVLANELLAEMRFQYWEHSKTPLTGLRAVLSFAALGVIDLGVLVTLLLLVGCVLVPFAGTAVGVFLGGIMLVLAPFLTSSLSAVVGPDLLAMFAEYGWLATALTGLGLIASGICAGAVSLIVTIGLVNALMRYGRLHYRVLQDRV